MMRNVFKYVGLFLLCSLVAGCGFKQRKPVSEDLMGPINHDSMMWPSLPPPTQLLSLLEYETLKTNWVTVTMVGDVNPEGKRKIRREMSKQSVYDAAGGWAGYSSYGLQPRSISVYRVSEGRTNNWKIPFKDMSKAEWKTFLFEEGDFVLVHTLM